MILAAQHLGHPHLDIVDRARQHIQPGTIGSPNDRVGQLRGIEFLLPADSVVPFNRDRMIEAKAPMRRDTLGLFRGPLLVGKLERRAIVDRRQATPQLDLALEI